jgi:peptidoglycan/LPS O-acetylase OafA/YrhL
MEFSVAPPARAGYYPFIDGLRAVAVLGVICFHFDLGSVSGGYAGVDVFFVLSGFLITQLIDARLTRGEFSFAHFYERRARRILPALAVTCALCAIAAWFLLMPRELREFSKSLYGAAFFYSNIVFAHATGYFADAQSTRPLLHTWSLAVEEQFYWFMPALLFFIHKLLPARRVGRFGLLLLLFAASLGCSVLRVRSDAETAFYLLSTRAWELLVGALIATAPWPLRAPRVLREAAAIAGVAMIGASFIWFDRATPFPGSAALLPCLGTALVVVANLDGETWIGRGLSLRGLVYVGLISYGLYLYHWPLLAFTRYFLDHALTPLQTAAVLAATFLVAFISYRLIEMPIRASKSLPSRRLLFGVAAGCLLSLGMAGIMGVNAHGFPSRLPAEALKYAQGARDRWPWDHCMPPVQRLNRATVCRVGIVSNAAPSFLVWGDSHAAALAPAVDARAKTLGLTGWLIGYSRCPALFGAAPMQHVADDHPCVEIAEKTYALIRDNHIQHVLLVSRWDSYVSGWERGGTETTQDLTIAYTADGIRLIGAPAFRRAVDDTLIRLRQAADDVWVLKEVPPQLIDVPSGLAKAVYFGRDAAALRRPYAQVEARQLTADEVFDQLAPALGASVIDPAELFCPGRTPCLIASQGQALYADGNHLSVFGARWSQRMLDPFFSSTIRSASHP